MHERIPLYIAFGILPSLIWLFYYLAKDKHPEPKKMVLKAFFAGALATIPVFLIQINLSGLLKQIPSSFYFPGWEFILAILKWFFVIAFTEEIFKYWAVKVTFLRKDDVDNLDEPTDFMIYMIVAALGFAALENILYMFSPLNNNVLSFRAILKTTLLISFIRFIGATFLHTLASGFLGYFLAKSFLLTHKRKSLLLRGILGATLLHGIYNFSIITLDTPFNLIVSVAAIVAAAVFIGYAFRSIRKLKSICEV